MLTGFDQRLDRCAKGSWFGRSARRFVLPYGATFFFLQFLSLCQAAAQETCFTLADEAKFPIYQQAPPPRDDSQRNYRFYPSTFAATTQIARLRENRSRIKGVYWQWANHGPRKTDGGRKGNITPGSPGVQIRFRSNEAANACTMAQTAAALGADASTYIRAGSLTAAKGQQSTDTLDVCVLAENSIPDGIPVLLDYEVADQRSAQETLAFLTQWAALVHAHARRTILYNNALDAPSQKQTQLTPVAADVAKIFDYVHILLWSRNAQGDVGRSFEKQAEAYNTSPSKIIIGFELKGTTLADAKTVYNVLMSKKAAALNLWRNYAEQGGSCSTETNKKIACVAFGRCN